MNRELAEGLAIEVLLWLAGDDEIMERFVGMSGVAPQDIRKRAAEPEFLGFVLDFLLSEDALVLAFCEKTGHDPANAMRARASLPGGDAVHWT